MGRSWFLGLLVIALSWVFFPAFMEFFSRDCVAVVQPITGDVTFAAEYGVDRFEHPELRRLATLLPAVLLQDRAASTAMTYLRTYKS